MASETKLGIIIFAAVACGLGFYGWKTFGAPKSNQVASTESGESGEGPESTGAATPAPPAEDPNAIPSAFGAVTPASASDEDLFNLQREPAGDEFSPAASDSVAASGAGRVELNPDEFGGLMEPGSGDPADTNAAGATARVAQSEAGLDAFGGTAELQPLEPAASAGGAQPLEDPWATAGTSEEDVFGVDPAATVSARGGSNATGDANDPWASPAEAGHVLGRPENTEAPAVAFDERSTTQPTTTTDPLEADGFTFSPEPDERPAAATASAAQPDNTLDPFSGAVSSGADSGAIARSQPDPFQPTEPGSAGGTGTELATDSRIAPRTIPRGADPFGDASATTGERFDSRIRGRTVAIEQPVGSLDSGARSTTSFNNGTYEVRRGDTFWSISNAVYGTPRYYRSLARHNAQVVPDPRSMPVGKVLSTPPASELESKFGKSLPPVASTVNTQTFDASQPRGLYLDARDNLFYRVGSGDSLGTIAQLHLGRASRASDIQRLNRDQLPTSNAILRPGMLLAMPDDASSVNSVHR